MLQARSLATACVQEAWDRCQSEGRPRDASFRADLEQALTQALLGLLNRQQSSPETILDDRDLMVLLSSYDASLDLLAAAASRSALAPYHEKRQQLVTEARKRGLLASRGQPDDRSARTAR
jgi:hypothetical protein